MREKYIIVWLNRNKNEYYYKRVKGTYMKYEIGYVNQYNHEVILVINIPELYIKKRTSIRTKLINGLIHLLDKLK